MHPAIVIGGKSIHQCSTSANSRLAEGQTRPTVTTEGVFFSPEFVHRPYQNSGHTGGSFFFTRIWSQTVPKFRTYRRIFLFHQNLVADLIATVIGEDLVVWTLLSSFPRSVGQLLKLPPYCSGPGGFSRSCPPSILRWDGLQGFGQFLYPPKGGIFSERADAFVISSNRQT